MTQQEAASRSGSGRICAIDAAATLLAGGMIAGAIIYVSIQNRPRGDNHQCTTA